MPVLTINEFCIRADNYANDLELLRELADYLTANRLEYSFINRSFMAEHLLEKIEAAKGPKLTELINLP